MYAEDACIEIPEEGMNEILYGSLETVKIPKEQIHTSSDYFVNFDGVIKYLKSVIENDESPVDRNGPTNFWPFANVLNVTVSV